jgi:hypothetical protein
MNEDNRKGDRSVSKGLLEALHALRSESEKESSQERIFGRKARSIDV